MILFKLHQLSSFSKLVLWCKIYPFALNSKNFASKDYEQSYENIPVKNIRNFSIIAHVDHGKSTLADRMLELCGANHRGKNQVLDSLQVEQERGITVKAQTCSLLYHYKDQTYLLNLIDTPGHVDFSNEVSRSLSPCSGVILLVDANQGVQAQTVANYYLAKSKNLHVIPVLNKIDLKNADPERCIKELNSLFDIEPEKVLKISAKLGTNVEDVLKSIVEELPHPISDEAGKLRAHLFDSSFDKYRGALNLVFIKDGEIEVGQEVTSHQTGKTYSVKSLSVITPLEVNVKKLSAGQIGLIGCNMRNSKEAIIGDTFFLKNQPVEALQTFQPQQPMVFAGIYPSEQSQHIALRGAIEKLVLNDSVVTMISDTSPALGQGWRLGFLGLLHLEVFSQRLEQEFDAEPIITTPSVTYKIILKGGKKISEYGGETVFISNPKLLPDPNHIEEYYEPTVIGTIISPSQYVGSVMTLCVDKRGVQRSSTNIDNDRIMLTYILPLSEIVLDFHDKLKSLSSGYASFDYEDNGYVETNLVRLDVLLNGTNVEELSSIVHLTKVNSYAKDLVRRLKELIPRQMVQIAIQASVGSKVIARETLKAFRKDVTAKLYGGDVTRRMKLLKNQAEGKKKMRSIANINVPRDTFIKVLKR